VGCTGENFFRHGFTRITRINLGKWDRTMLGREHPLPKAGTLDPLTIILAFHGDDAAHLV
jgi:hypothetical protein